MFILKSWWCPQKFGRKFSRAKIHVFFWKKKSFPRMSSGRGTSTFFDKSLVVKLSRWARDDFTNKKTLKRMLVSEMKVGKLVRLQDVLMALMDADPDA